MSQIISSESNSKFKMWKSLTTAKGIKQELAFILSGEKIIREYLQSQELQNKFPLWSILVPYENSALDSSDVNNNAKNIETRLIQSPFGSEIFATLKTKNTFSPHKDLFYIPKNLFDSLDVVGTHQPLLILKFTEFAAWSPEAIDNHSIAPTTAPKLLLKNSVDDSKSDVELISPVGDPKNLGAILRSCDAFGVSKIILTAESCHPFLPQALKASSLSALRMTFFKGPALKEIFFSKENPSQKIISSTSVKNKNDDSSMTPPNATIPSIATASLATAVPFLALDSKGTSLTEFQWPTKFRLVLGQEGQGLPDTATNIVQKISIPTKNVESLNVAIATSLALFHYSIQKT